MSDKKEDEWVRTAVGRKVLRSEMEGSEKPPGLDEKEPVPVQLDTAERVKKIQATIGALRRQEITFSDGFRDLVLAANDIYGSHLAGKTATPDEWAETTSTLMTVMCAMDSFIKDQIRKEESKASRSRGPVFIRIVDLGAIFGGPGGGGEFN